MIVVSPSDMPVMLLDTAKSGDRVRKHRATKRQKRLDYVAVLDMETDPFDSDKPNDRIVPFTACLMSDHFEPIVIWEEDETTFVDKVITAIEELPDAYTIYAHNGGKFDFLFLMSRLRGEVMFKGRGIMVASVGRHELRDSFHIIPEKLAAYQKDKFDYTKLTKRRRAKHKDEIIKYMVSDCRYLLEIVKAFLQTYGFKISIGQAAMAVLRKDYKVDNIPWWQDEKLRRYFFGGRVECIQGKGIFEGAYKLYDVNSMYPAVMSNYKHPIGREYIERCGMPGTNTIFIQLECFNKGALVCRSEAGDTIAPYGRGRFFTSVWEYNVALKYGLIEDVNIICCVDCEKRSDFSKFVQPLYAQRQLTKQQLRLLSPTNELYPEVKREDIFLKLIMNNAYGKFAQNPRKFRQHYLTEPEIRPPTEAGDWGDFPSMISGSYWIWSKPTEELKFNNVGTAASITGAARSVLLEAIQNAIDPIYCDTDSLICKELNNTHLCEHTLGAWDLEKEMFAVIVAGKKLYAYRDAKENVKVKSKGVSGLDWNDMLALLAGDVLEKTNGAPTFTRTGSQFYMRRKVRATAKESPHVTSKQGVRNFAGTSS